MGGEKIYDIRPKPKSAAKKLAQENKPSAKGGKALSSAEKNIGKESKQRKGKSDLKAGNFLKTNKYWLFLPVGLLVALIVFFQLSAKASIEIWPAERPLSFQKQILIDAKADKSRFSNNVVMGKEVNQEGELTKKISATGSAVEETKAGGTIKIINNYHLAQILVQKTRFLSADGKLFYLQEEVSIPPSGSLEANVEAAEAGPDYNIKPTTFSIPGLLGSPRYTSVYAESLSPMQGGERKTVAQVIKGDLDKAEEKTGQELFSSLEQKLKEEAGASYSLLSGTIESRVLEKTFSQAAGDKNQDFDCFLKMEAQGIAFQKQDFDELIEYLILEEIDEGEEIKKATIVVSQEIKDFDLTDGKVSLDVNISATIFKSIDISALKKALSGKSIKESEMLLASDPAINKVELRISPFWLLNMPQNLERININFGLGY